MEEHSPQDLLTQAVVETTGLPDAKPRAPQAQLSQWIEQAFTADGQHLCVQAVTGCGKSIAYLTPAFRAAAQHRQRTLISTEGLSLQRQIVTKDAPAVAAATVKVFGTQPTVAVLKGFSNYVCREATENTARRIFRRTGEQSGADVITRLQTVKNTMDATTQLRISGITSTVGTLVDLVLWALEHCQDPINGQRDECPIPVDREWSLVSVPSGQCDNYADPDNACAGHQAKAMASTADIVVTNHTLMAIQATKNIPVLVDSETLGQFDHIIIDEAHALPLVVRSNGAVEITAPRIRRLISKIVESDDDEAQASPQTKAAGQEVIELLPYVEHAMQDVLGNANHNEEVWFEHGQDIAELEALGDKIRALKNLITNDALLPKDVRMQHIGACDTLIDDIDLVSTDIPDTARWAIRSTTASGAVVPSFAASPIDVSSKLYHRLWTRQALADDHETADVWASLTDELQDQTNDVSEAFVDKTSDRQRSTVVAVSATMTDDFPYESGLSTRVRDVSTPFEHAYQNSALYIPTPGDDDIDIIGVQRWGKTRMDTQAHHRWAQEHMLELLFANKGSAMVICATARSAKAYAQAIQDDPTLSFAVYTQWDRRGRAAAIQDWNADTSSVIVGTRSLMTGVDAPGATNTLVIIDRPARAPMNPVDTARCTALTDRGVNKFAADTRVYVQDAATLLAQAAGRLIRSSTDRGMVAVLDPRLRHGTPLTYNAATRNMYMSAVDQYGYDFDHLDDALDWLETRVTAASETPVLT